MNKSLSVDCPVLLIAWRRPQTISIVIDAIRQVSPNRLFIACDGPNPAHPGEAEKVEATRKVIEDRIDWHCNISRLYSDENQGCRLGPIRAINWFFEQVDEGIILEDDCVPHPDFFAYCATLLQRYREDRRVWCIGGSNFQRGNIRGKGSYYFSRYPHTWGWATWRRCWDHYDADLRSWPKVRQSTYLDSIFEDRYEQLHWSEFWERLYTNALPNTCWDYQWCLTCMVNGGLTALPNHNLVRNIGFDADATHTPYANAEPGSLARFVIDSTSQLEGFSSALTHPPFILRDVAADRFEFEHKLGGMAMKRQRRFHRRLVRSLRRCLGRFGR